MKDPILLVYPFSLRNNLCCVSFSILIRCLTRLPEELIIAGKAINSCAAL